MSHHTSPTRRSLGRELQQQLSAVLKSAQAARAHADSLRADPNRLVGPEEASAITGLRISSLAVYRATRRLPAKSRLHQRVKYLVRDLLDYVANHGRCA
jgi:hypothetical protein